MASVKLHLNGQTPGASIPYLRDCR